MPMSTLAAIAGLNLGGILGRQMRHVRAHAQDIQDMRPQRAIFPQ